MRVGKASLSSSMWVMTSTFSKSSWMELMASFSFSSPLLSWVPKPSSMMRVGSGAPARLASSRESVLLASLMLKGSYDSSAVASWIHEHRVDGLMFVRYTRRERGLLESALRADLPVVLLAPDIAPAAAFIVRCDNVNR